jgi:hypothetical protein
MAIFAPNFKITFLTLKSVMMLQQQKLKLCEPDADVAIIETTLLSSSFT